MDPVNPWQAPIIISLERDLLELMRSHIAECDPEESCGFLAGTRQANHFHATESIPVGNALHSPVRFRMDPAEQFAAFNKIDQAGLELVGIYHSHPSGPPYPSDTDLAEAYYPEVAYLIWSKSDKTWDCRAFALHAGAFQPINIEIAPSA